MATATLDAAETLPRWDLDSIFPGPESPEFREAIDGVAGGVAEMEGVFDRYGVGTRPPGPVTDEAIAAFEHVIDRYNALLERAATIEGYLFCLVASDVRDEAAQGAAGEWRLRKADLARLAPRFTAWVGTLDLDALAARSPIARDHLPALRRLLAAANHLMAPGEEDLAAALGPSGSAAWMAMRDDLAGRATARIVLDGEEQELALSEIGNLGYNPDRDVRRRAHETEEAAWRGMAVPLAAAINGVKGQQLALSTRRGWDDPLDQALFANAIDRPTLDALMLAIAEALPDYRRYLRTKAKVLGVPILAYYDVFAPVGEPAPWPFATAREFIIAQFGAYNPDLAALAARAFAEQWIDAGPRPGKDGGAFSMPVGGDQSRVFLNFLPVYDWMSALAHELGHSYHCAVIVQKRRTFLQAPMEMTGSPMTCPMTLAETASTICEAIVQRAARSGLRPAQEAAMLDGWLQTLSLNVFGSLALFSIEQGAFAARRQRELSPAELDALAVNAWREVAGDAIDPDTLRASLWTIPHFYIDGLWYYNFPYAFGMLFGLGLLSLRDADPEGFFARFDQLLADSGMHEAGDLAARFGIDLRDPAFWRSSLDLFRADVDRYEALANGGDRVTG